MIRKTIPWNVKQVCNMIEKGTLTFDNPVQRPAGQWKDTDKSLLIHSVLTMFVPDIYVIQIRGEKSNTYDVIDGKQRLTNISSFLSDQWELTELPLIKLESTGEVFNISGLKFSQLIVEDIFYRLNNGKAVSREHMALVTARHNVQEFVHRIITEHSLYTKVAHFADSSIKKSDREMSVLQSIALVSKKDFSSFAAKDIEKSFAENDITEDTLTATEQAFTAIAEAFKNEKSKFVTKINISAMAYMFSQATDITEATDNLLKYVEFITSAKRDERNKDRYKSYCGAGCTKKDIVTKRVNAMLELCKVTEQPITVNDPEQEETEETEDNSEELTA